ncbi:hypothetical protein [Streptomyces kronopolitis]|uniref:hypothetical protein n=1 Tax=Streptomyces kronopolitis TaxID=1612435 RepID=UPI0020C068C6|nr:hypothetical protein [Streptomyces kronopolitis]MCL6297455.1 hypothetical protein [Streptomyces kronopolitis]
MSAVLVLPAAVRLPRTVAVRRALLAGLFLAGFVALGFAFGPGAHAADRTRTADLPGLTAPAETATGASTPDRAATRDGSAIQNDRAGQANEAAQAAQAAQAGQADRTGRAKQLSRAGTTLARQGKASGAELARRAHTVSDKVAETVRPATGRAASATGRLTRPVSRVVREIGDSARAALPVHLPSGEHTGHPGDGGAQQHGRTPDGDRTAGQRGPCTQADAGTGRAAHLVNGPRTAADEHPSATVHEQRDPGHHGLPGQSPQGPVAPASHSAGDGHGPRGGDQHAADPADSLRFRLLPGGVRTADGAPTRRRAEDILEFPG